MSTRLHVLVIMAVLTAGCSRPYSAVRDVTREKTAFQTSSWWKPVTDVRSDISIVYGANDYNEMTFQERVQSWRNRGYKTHFMTGIAWGNYEDYFTGKWDGKPHFDEGQMNMAGDTLWHGYMVPYIVPTANYISYIKERQVKRAIDAGIDAIYLEEPEFWANAGYSEAFKREWKDYYGFDWRPQHESPENTYLSNKLKYYLYYRALDEVCSFAKEYGKSKGMDVRCYVPTHSLVNYSAWSIVSPEASLASLPSIDGYIAQVWTGTSRTPNHFDGKRAERVFETAFLEYGSMESMTAPTGRKVFFLTDPIEDWPRDWSDYKKNYQSTFVAQLLYPGISDYEVMPWPDRIYEGLFLNPETGEKERIPASYATQMQIMVNALADMPLSSNKVSGTDGIGVMMCNSLMFQRGVDHNGYSNPDFANFFGRTMPLVKRGVPVKTMHLENLGYEESWKDIKVAILSYSDMKPMEEEMHSYIASWVRNGGHLVYCGRDDDPYQNVPEWWNAKDYEYGAPSQHLFSMMSMPADAKDGEYSYGKGKVYVLRQDPKEFVLEENADSLFLQTVVRAYSDATGGEKIMMKNSFYLERGPFLVAAVMDETDDMTPMMIAGKFVDLFDSALPVIDTCTVKPGEQAFLYDLEELSGISRPSVIASAACVEEESYEDGVYRLLLKSPANTVNTMRIYFPKRFSSVSVTGADGAAVSLDRNIWDESTSTCFMSFANSPDGIELVFR